MRSRSLTPVAGLHTENRGLAFGLQDHALADDGSHALQLALPTLWRVPRFIGVLAVVRPSIPDVVHADFLDARIDGTNADYITLNSCDRRPAGAPRKESYAPGNPTDGEQDCESSNPPVASSCSVGRRQE